MKVDKIVTVKEDLDIVGATLLSIEEAEKLPLELRRYNCWWLLRSPGCDSYYATFVDDDGSICDFGDLVNYDLHSVRPALIITNIESSNLKIGDKFEFGGKPFQIISNKLAFCLTDIGMCCFREDWQAKDANDYEKSDVKKYVDKWFNESKEEQ